MPEAAGRYESRVAIVTGARRGIGKTIAAHFLAEGAQVIGFARNGATLEHARYAHFALDIGDDDAVRAAFREIGRRFPSLDILVNNAAVLTSQYALLMPASKARAMVSTNLLGTLFVSREAAKLMGRRKFGRIINIGSMAAALEPAGDSVYAATKTAAMTLAGVLAKELAGLNITCNTLGITAFPSDMLAQLPREKIEAVVATLPLPRCATAEDILNVIDFFASERSGYVTAQTVFLGGVH
jgi:3-oxoacyl-[acyl-carrier protein] reductase